MSGTDYDTQWADGLASLYSAPLANPPAGTDTLLGESGGVKERFQFRWLQPFVSAGSYGVTADGTTDDTAALNAAVQAAGANGAVQLPAGSINLTAAVALNLAGVTLFGCGRRLTTLLAPIGTANAVEITAADVTVADLGINGRYDSQAGTGGQGQRHGILFGAGCVRPRIIGCRVFDTAQHAIAAFSAGRGEDCLICDCDIEHRATAAGVLTGSPTTTSLPLRTGEGARFVAGQSVRVMARASVVSATPTTVTVTAGRGSRFVSGQLVTVGNNSNVTITGISTDTLTVASWPSGTPTAGQVVYQSQSTTVSSVGTDTLTVAALGYAPPVNTWAASSPTLGSFSTTAGVGGVQKGIYLQGAILRPRVIGNRISGWSQAVGLWYGVRGGQVIGNVIRGNYGSEHWAFEDYRSACEDYGATVAGHGGNLWAHNTVDGSTSYCFEIASGVDASRVVGNYTTNPGVLTGYGGHFQVAGVSGEVTRDVLVAHNLCVSAGHWADPCLVIAGPAYRTAFRANTLRDFSISSNGSVIVGGTSGNVGVDVDDNILDNCAAGVRVVAASGPVNIRRNTFNRRTDGNYRDIQIDAGNYTLVADNTCEDQVAPGTTGVGIEVASGAKGVRVLRNRCGGQTPIITNGADTLVMHNRVVKISNDGAGAIRMNGARGVCRFNVAEFTGNPARTISVAGEDCVVTGNVLIGATAAVYVSGPTRFTIEPNSTDQTNGVRPETLRKLAGVTVNATETTIAHGLGYTPSVVSPVIRGSTGTWVKLGPTAADATNIYLIASDASTTVDVYLR